MSHCAGGIDASVSARGAGQAAGQQALLARTLHKEAQRGSLTARAAATSTSTSTSAQQHAQQQHAQQQQQQQEDAGAEGEAEEEGSAWESGAISAAQALKRYKQYLTPFEQSEVLDFPEVRVLRRKRI